MSAHYYRLRIRDAANANDAVVITSVRGGPNPYLKDAPTGDGREFDPLTGQARQGAFTGRIVDAITAGASRVFTSQLEDGYHRQQLLDRVGYYEWSADGVTWPTAAGGVLCAGYVTNIRQVSAIEWEVTVSDGLRAVDTAQAFAPKYGSGGHLEDISSFLARWPNRGCVFGGPVIGGFLSMQDYNGWFFEVNDQNATESFLKFESGYGPPNFNRTTNPRDVADAVNQAMTALYTPSADAVAGSLTTVDDADYSHWPGVVIDVAGYGYFMPSDGRTLWNPVGGAYIRAHGFAEFFKMPKWGGIYIGGNTIPLNTRFLRVRAYTARPTEISPIYWSGHPADLLTKLWDEQGFVYNAAAAAALKQNLGAGKRLSLRITGPETLQSLLADTLCGPFGIGVRMNDDGELEPFVSRIFANSAPSVVITADDVRDPTREAAPVAFELDEQTALRVMTFEQTQLVPTTESGGGGIAGQFRSNPTDGFATYTSRVEYTSGDLGAIGNRSVAYRIPGMAHLDQTIHTTNRYLQAVAKEIFDRWGRGIIATEIALKRGGAGDNLKLGDECIVALPQLPNQNYRIGDNNAIPGRRMQVVRITPAPGGNILKLLDSGPNAQPLATVPALTIAASSDAPRTVAEITVTNAATINAMPAGVRIQIAVTTGGAPALTDYADLTAFQPGQVPTGPIRTLAVTAGRTVYARARTEQPGAQPSNRSAGVSVALTALAAVANLTATPSGTDGSLCTLAWANGANGALVVLDVAVRLAADPATRDDWRIRGMDGGSVQYVLDALTPGSTYTATVQVRDLTSGDTAQATVTFTAGVGTRTLPTPMSPTGFSGAMLRTLAPLVFLEYGADALAGYGIAVVALDFPGQVEVAEAIETAAGSGIYGAFVTSSVRVPSVQDDWTKWLAFAPDDGLRRQLKARHVREGCTPSPYTAVVTVAPWTAQALPPFLGAVGNTDLQGFTFVDSADGTQRTFQWTRTALVDTVFVYARTLRAPVTGDPFDFSAEGPTAILAAGTDQYTVAKPPSGQQVFLQFEPRQAPPNYQAGVVRRAIVDPAAPAMAARIRTLVTNDTADLSIDVDAGASDWPVQVDVFEDDPDGAAIVSTSLSAAATLDKTGFPALGGRALPLRAARRWYVRLTNVAGLLAWGTAAADRDALPAGTVTASDYRAAPQLVGACDDDTDQIRITVPGGKTKTIAVAAGSGGATYSVGDVLDDASTETLLAVDEVRSGYLVEFQGGGQWRTIWEGPLHGTPSNPPTAQPRAVKNASASAEDVYVVVASPVGEALRLYVRDAEDAAAPIYALVAGAADSTPLYVASGTELGPGSYFVTGADAPVAMLAAVALTRDQVKRLYVQVEGHHSLVRSSWIPITLSLQEQPWLESVSLTWDEGTGSLRLRARGGAHCVSAFFEVDDNAAFSSPSTASAALADGGDVTQTFALTDADRGKTWYGRVTPFNAAAEGGLAGVGQVDETAVPDVAPSLTVTPTPGTSSYSIAWSGTGVITLSIDGGAYGTPPASPIPVTRDNADHTYAFKAVSGGQTITQTVTVPALPGSSLLGFGNLRDTKDDTADTVTAQWDYGPSDPASFTFYWQENGASTWNSIAALTGSARSYQFSPGHDLVSSGTSVTVTWNQYVEAYDAGGNLLYRSTQWSYTSKALV